jgi:hypothetical protein
MEVKLRIIGLIACVKQRMKYLSDLILTTTLPGLVIIHSTVEENY